MGNSSLAALRQNSFFHSPSFSPCQHCTHPSYTDREGLGITSFSSMPTMLPKPSHVWHAPAGELKANILSDGCSKVMPSASKRVENSLCEPSEAKITMHTPSPSKKAVSAESHRRISISWLLDTRMRSMTTYRSFMFADSLPSAWSAFSRKSSMRENSPLCMMRV